MGSVKILGVIPARYAATRLPGKPLALIAGKPMVQWVYEAAKRSKILTDVVVATDDPRIMATVEGFGGQSILTSNNLVSGTDRVAAVAEKMDANVYVNIQGDEPLMNEAAIDSAVQMVVSGQFKMASAMTPLVSVEELQNINVVKVICDRHGRALYFSRFPIPYSRFPEANVQKFICKRHLGLYVYDKETLMTLTQLPASPVEAGESLEQLRALEYGVSIGVALVQCDSFGIDTPEDLSRVNQIFLQMKKA